VERRHFFYHPSHSGYTSNLIIRSAHGASDHLYNFLTAAGAVAAVLAFGGGLIVGYLYSRKANVSISADVHRTARGVVLAARPSVNAFGPFPLKFKEAQIEVYPVYPTEQGGTFTDTGHPKTRDAFPDDEKGRPQFVSPGETLTSTALFRVDDGDTAGVLGWVVTLSISSQGRIRQGLHWGDRVFVPVASPAKKGEPDGQEGGAGEASGSEAEAG